MASEFPTVLTHNLMLLPSGITDWEPDRRASIAAEAGYLQPNGILVLTELFDNSATDEYLFPLLASHHPYRTPVIGRSSSGWDRTTGGYYGTPLEDGGVVIASKWPIRHRAQHIYGGGCGADYWAAKGFAYAVIDAAGKRIHVVGTHLQADDPGCSGGEAAWIRANQLNSIAGYLAQRSIPSGEAVVIAGDFNIPKASSEYIGLLDRLRVNSPQGSNDMTPSYDPSTNSVANYRDRRGVPVQLDYVFLRKGNLTPEGGWINHTLDIHSRSYLMREQVFRDFSDHYPVSAGGAGKLTRRMP
ncbi:sphingomyelin phosphodiesterase [Streptomyces sp. NPDC015127]|uniref:sphingomyelin phosphodiesterase n=1 Tax=Streptomyces sp. NPDC015127 TaxID=3364939 RepID=UPI0036FF3BAD